MLYPFENRRKAVGYAVAWMMYAVLQALALRGIMQLPFSLLWVDALIHAALFAVAGVLLWSVMHYGNYEKLPAVRRAMNYGALGLIVVALWTGVGYGLDLALLGEKATALFLPLAPFYVWIGGLLYLMVVLYYQNKITATKLLAKENEEESGRPDKPPVEEIKPAPGVEIIERIAVKSGQKLHVILVPDILYLQADGDYVHVFTADGKYLKEQTMKYFEDGLPPRQFVRVHRSYIVNVGAISSIELYEKQSQLLILKNGHRIKISVSGYKLLKSRLGL
jgi:DNA-binding LytR/AlgR family response regulator